MPKAKPIPDGYHTLTPHIYVSDAARAIDFYKKAFDAKERLRVPGPGGMILHAEIQIGDSIVMMAQENEQMGTKSPLKLGGTAVVLNLYVTDCDKAFQRAVGAGATALMPPADMFWGDRFSMVADPFGHQWSIATHIQDLSGEEIAKAAAAAFGG